MVEVDLPIAFADTKIESAIELMQRAHRSAVVVERDGEIALFEAKHLVRELRDQGNIELAELSPSPSHRTFSSPSTEALHEDSWLQSSREGQFIRDDKLFDSLRKQGVNYAVLTPKLTLLRIVTESEMHAGPLLQTAVVCRCPKNPRHAWTPDELHVQGRCNLHTDTPLTCTP